MQSRVPRMHRLKIGAISAFHYDLFIRPQSEANRYSVRPFISLSILLLLFRWFFVAFWVADLKGTMSFKTQG